MQWYTNMRPRCPSRYNTKNGTSRSHPPRTTWQPCAGSQIEVKGLFECVFLNAVALLFQQPAQSVLVAPPLPAYHLPTIINHSILCDGVTSVSCRQCEAHEMPACMHLQPFAAAAAAAKLDFTFYSMSGPIPGLSLSFL